MHMHACQAEHSPRLLFFLLLFSLPLSFSVSLSLFLFCFFCATLAVISMCPFVHSSSSFSFCTCHLGVHHHLLLVSFLVVSAFVFPSLSFPFAPCTPESSVCRGAWGPPSGTRGTPCALQHPTTPTARAGGGGPLCARGTRDSFSGTSCSSSGSGRRVRG